MRMNVLFEKMSKNSISFVVQNYNPQLLDSMLYDMILSEHSMEELLEYKIANEYSISLLAIKNSTPESILELRGLGEA